MAYFPNIEYYTSFYNACVMGKKLVFLIFVKQMQLYGEIQNVKLLLKDNKKLASEIEGKIREFYNIDSKKTSE